MKKLRPLLCLLVSTALLLSCTACGNTDDKTDEVKTVVVGTTASHAPYAYHLNSNGADTITGSDIDLAKKIADKAGYNLEIKDFTYDELLNQLDLGNVDFVIAAMPEINNEDVLCSRPYTEDELCCLVRSDDSTKFPDTASLSGQTVGIMTGTTDHELKALNLSEKTTTKTMDADDMITALQNEKIKAAILPQAMADCYLEEKGDLASAFSLSAGNLYVLVRYTNTVFLDTINDVLATLKKSDSIKDWMINASSTAIDYYSSPTAESD